MSPPPVTPVLAGNLDALAAALGVALPPVAVAGRWEQTATGDGVALQLRTAAGALVAAHSRRAPDVEAARQIDTALAGRPLPAFAIVIGAGLGYVVEALVGRDPAIHVLVLEPDASGAAAFLGRRDWRAAIAAGRLLVLSGPEYRGADRAWRVVPATSTDPLILGHPALVREYPNDVRQAGAVGARVVSDARANTGAEAALAGPYLLNTIENLGVVVHEGDVSTLAGAFAGVPAIVVAAGPSLDAVAADVGRYADRALVIAVDTALRPLLARGVSPHLCVAVDPSERNARHLTALTGAGATWLAAEASVHPRAFEAFAGRTFTFAVGANQPWPWLEAHGITRGRLAAWGSVLVSALDLAVHVGAGPIAIVGADLAYTGGQPYCRGTAFEEDWAREVRLGSTLEAVWTRVVKRAGAQEQPDLHGRPTPTLPHLVAFRDHLRDRIANAGVRVVNATGGGILHGHGVELASLDDAFAGVGPLAADPRARLRERRAESVAGRSAETAATLAAALALAETPSTLGALVPTVGLDRVRASVARARTSLAVPRGDRPPASVNVAPWTPPVWLPEQAAALAWLHDDTRPRPAPVGGAVASLDDLVAAARALLAHAPLATGDPDVDALRADLLALPLPLVLAFADDARRDVARVGDALTRWIGTQAARAPAIDAFWTASATSVDDATDAEPAPGDAVHRVAIVTTLAWAIARGGHADAGVDRVAARVAAVGPRTAWSADGGPRVSLALAVPDGPTLPWIADAPIAAFARALTGTMFAASAPLPRTSADAVALTGSLALPAAVSIHGPLRVVPGAPARLLAAACGPCLSASILDRGHALVTRLDLSGSCVVDGRGVVDPAPRWPRPILGEGRWPDGRAYAWLHKPARLMVRDPDGTVTHDAALPCTPVSVEADGAGLRIAARDGVWRWTGADGVDQVVATPPLVAAFADPDGTLRLMALPPQTPSEAEPVRAWTWHPTVGLQPALVGPLGPCWSRSRADGWVAEALPESHLVRVTHGGVESWIVCESPRTVAWAGEGLVVVQIGGTVLHVPGVRDRLASA